MINLDAIEAAAKSATPGPWVYGSDGLNRLNNIRHYVEGTQLERDELLDDHVPALIAYGIEDVNASHIAAANPAAVLEMVSMIRKRDAVLRQALEALDWLPTSDHMLGLWNRQQVALEVIKEVLEP